MKSTCMIVLVLALLVAPPLSNGTASDGKDEQRAPTCSYNETKGKEDNRVVNNLILLPISDDKHRMRLWKELVRLAQPVTLEVPANRSTLEALQARCGSAPPDLQQILAKLNPGRNQWISNKSRPLTFIPCPFWAFLKYNHPETKIPIRKGQSIDDVLPLYMGIAGPGNKKKIKDPQKLLDAKGMAKSDGTLLIPYLTKPMTFRLRDEIKENNDQVVDALNKQFLDKRLFEIAKFNKADPGMSYYLVVQHGPQGEVCLTSCKEADEDSQWPYNLKQIVKKYEDLLGNGEGVQTVVLVTDTGLDLSDPTINRNLWTDIRVVRKLEKKYGENPHGTNLTNLTAGGIGISPEYEFKAHGTEVVKIMTGGPFAPATFPAPFKIAIAKVIPDNPDNGSFDIKAEAVANSFMYSSYIHAKMVVVNLSLVIDTEEARLTAGMNGIKGANILVVSAAGNDNQEVKKEGVCPPCLTDYPSQLIVVGAHDWANQKADFSNYGQNVDLLAPGCAIPVRGNDGEIQLLSGTSFAAPFVAFTAALLGTYGMSPGEIKGRILLTVDFDEQLVGKTVSAGRLNIENALSLKDDILNVKVKVKDESGNDIEKVVPLYGKLDPLQTWICKRKNMDDAPFNPNAVGRIVPLSPRVINGAGKLSYPSSGKLTEIDCDSLQWAPSKPKVANSESDYIVSFQLKGVNSESDYVDYERSAVISIIPKLPDQ